MELIDFGFMVWVFNVCHPDVFV